MSSVYNFICIRSEKSVGIYMYKIYVCIYIFYVYLGNKEKE